MLSIQKLLYNQIFKKLAKLKYLIPIVNKGRIAVVKLKKDFAQI